MLHRYATPLGLAAAACAAAIAGALTHWSWPIVAGTGIAGLWVFPRTFYGRAASRALDDAPAQPGSLWAQRQRAPYLPDIAGTDDKSVQLEQDYLAAQARARGELDINGNADPDAFGKSTGKQESTLLDLFPRHMTIAIVGGFVALCGLIIAIQYAAEQFKLRTHAHHWYAVNLYASGGGRYTRPHGVEITGVEGPYTTREACERFVKTKSSSYGMMACRQMTDADANKAQDIPRLTH